MEDFLSIPSVVIFNDKSFILLFLDDNNARIQSWKQHGGLLHMQNYFSTVRGSKQEKVEVGFMFLKL